MAPCCSSLQSIFHFSFIPITEKLIDEGKKPINSSLSHQPIKDIWLIWWNEKIVDWICFINCDWNYELMKKKDIITVARLKLTAGAWKKLNFWFFEWWALVVLIIRERMERMKQSKGWAGVKTCKSLNGARPACSWMSGMGPQGANAPR